MKENTLETVAPIGNYNKLLKVTDLHIWLIPERDPIIILQNTDPVIIKW